MPADSSRRSNAAYTALAVLGLACVTLAACGGARPSTPFAGLTLVSSATTPFPTDCNGAPQSGVVYPGSAVEPFLAIDPINPSHLIGVWQQDRWSNAGASGILTGVSRDGGRTWTRTSGHLSRCTGGTAANSGDYERASDPWISFSPDGTAYQISVSFNNSSPAKAILVSRTTDGGDTWDEPIPLARDQSTNVAVDKESITADPRQSGLVYVVWDRLDNLDNPNPALMTGPTWFSRLFNGAWEPSRIIYDPGPNAQTIANQIAVLPDGTLVNLFMLLGQVSAPDPDRRVAIQRSRDQGVSWSSPILVERSLTVGVKDPKSGRSVRAGSLIPGVAADPVTGTLFVVWQDSRFSGGLRDGIALSTSIDAGLTWSMPIQVNQAPQVAAFTPAISVSSSGRVAVTYYDFRADSPADPNALLTTYWLATSDDAGATWQESALAEAFDLRTAPLADGYFVGDYEGLATDGSSFVPFFSAAAFAGSSNITGIYVQTKTER